ncbi:uncharacterized protein LOC141855659 [Brevipalpus obovatus]|uniref:uncharacterized protein LOC141855659 n=1 Tax=Brevipalpus obovatus TaxID=246614 RepID=UPI003D9F7493
MSKFYLIALFVTLIGVASGFDWCDKTKNKLSSSTDYQGMRSVIKDIIDYLMAAKHEDEATEIQYSLDDLFWGNKGDQEDIERATEEAKRFASTWLQKCESFSEEWEKDIHNRFLDAITRRELMDVMGRIASFLQIQGATEKAREFNDVIDHTMSEESFRFAWKYTEAYFN